MYERNGIGLSANQVGVRKRIFVMDTSNSGSRRNVFINPVITDFKNEDRFREGCLSFPDIFAFVKRPTEITISALNENGEETIMHLSGIEAICFQHELDHLNGIQFIDHLSPVQLNLIKKRLKKLK
jgi:peptide deformylase